MTMNEKLKALLVELQSKTPEEISSDFYSSIAQIYSFRFLNSSFVRVRFNELFDAEEINVLPSSRPPFFGFPEVDEMTTYAANDECYSLENALCA